MNSPGNKSSWNTFFFFKKKKLKFYKKNSYNHEYRLNPFLGGKTFYDYFETFSRTENAKKDFTLNRVFLVILSNKVIGTR